MSIQLLRAKSLSLTLAVVLLAGIASASGPPKVTYASLCQKAESSIDEGQFNVALTYAQKAIALNQQGWKAFSLAAKSAYYLDQASQSEIYMKKALSLAPSASRATLEEISQAITTLKTYKMHLISGNERKAALQVEDAGREYAAAYRASPRHYEAALQAVEMYRKANDTDNALEILQSLADSKLVPESVHNRVRMLIDGVAQGPAGVETAATPNPAKPTNTTTTTTTSTAQADAAKAAEAERKRQEDEKAKADEQAKKDAQAKADAQKAADEAEKKRLADMEAQKKADELAKKQAADAERQKQIDMLKGDLVDAKSVQTSAQADLDNAHSSMDSAQSKLSNDQGRLDTATQDMQRHFDNAANFDAQAASANGALANFYRTQANIERLAGNLGKIAVSQAQDSVNKDNRDIEASQRAIDNAQRKLDDANGKVKDLEDRIDRLIAAGSNGGGERSNAI